MLVFYVARLHDASFLSRVAVVKFKLDCHSEPNLSVTLAVPSNSRFLATLGMTMGGGVRDGQGVQPSPKETERPVPLKARAVPDDCLGLTKRWSLYVAPSVNSGSRMRLAAGRINPNSPVV